MRKLMIVVGGSLALAAPLADADVLGVGANVSYWDSDFSGEVVNKDSAVDIEKDLNLDSDSNANFTAFFEHPIPVLPNVRLNYTSISQSGRGEIGLEAFDDIPVGAEVKSDLDIDQLDVTLYYEVLDNWVNLDLGLTARRFDGELVLRDQTPLSTKVSETSVDAVVPMGYLAARFDLPLTGVSLGAEGNFISYSGDSLHDFNAYGQYEFAMLQLRAGYRQMAIDYEDDDDKLDVEMSGPFASVGVAF
ncbi:TIGR04219 family outer membrane beta-barrel protein [Marinobacter nauticus]|uniref:TIGR04219 family outer membrane beta-barrel protein n=1 Tax=Marinobacter nauticus TaxID=2743 RepID=UPI001C95173F|nr:TIGR04219 family outer membrane beta-barrel protein [Marinobacter nauticus]MBY6221325.1 TIGR04219 family outer membrane beta-barrel protein [Marinobacter nauticus]